MYEQFSLFDLLKRCNMCKACLPATLQYFSANKRLKDGFQSQCKPCRLELKRRSYVLNRGPVLRSSLDWKAKNRERVREYARLYFTENPTKRRANEQRRRARLKAAIGTHTAQDLSDLHESQNGLCAYCEISLPESYHVDHMVPLSRGGTDDALNLALSCADCNNKKHTSTVEEYWAKIRDRE